MLFSFLVVKKLKTLQVIFYLFKKDENVNI